MDFFLSLFNTLKCGPKDFTMALHSQICSVTTIARELLAPLGTILVYTLVQKNKAFSESAHLKRK